LTQNQDSFSSSLSVFCWYSGHLTRAVYWIYFSVPCRINTSKKRGHLTRCIEFIQALHVESTLRKKGVLFFWKKKQNFVQGREGARHTMFVVHERACQLRIATARYAAACCTPLALFWQSPNRALCLLYCTCTWRCCAPRPRWILGRIAAWYRYFCK